MDSYTYLTDIQGSTGTILDESGTAEAVYTYSDFGEVTELIEAIDNEICYTGSIHDETTGLHYMNARYYDPANGRFISQDSYRGEMNDPGQWHLYVYCANNPINYADPSGHEAMTLMFWGGMILCTVIIAEVTTTAEFQEAWNNATGQILGELNNISSYARAQAKMLVKAIGNSFKKAKKKYNEKEDHHIVAKKAKRAKKARDILDKDDVKIGLDSECNIVRLKKGLHKRLHRWSYYRMVNNIVKNAYKKEESKKKNVKAALSTIKSFLKDLNEASPF